jgi:DmsE family decaheme c-type cytochrome
LINRNIAGFVLYRIRMFSTQLFKILLISALASVVMAQAEEIDDETCLMCHDGYDRVLLQGAHRLSSQTVKPAVTIACITCHEGGATHANDPSIENISNPAKLSEADAIALCTQCHQPHTERGTVAFDPHIGQGLSCTSCHSIHKGFTSLLLDDEAAFCGRCHVAVVNDFRSRSNHPLTDGDVTCLSCHDFTGKNSPNFGHGGNANCYQCHPEKGGPYRFEHEAASSFTTEGEGCTTCHFPHGSPNERLLKRPDNSLCRQCHGLPPGHLTVHDGIGSSYGCIECHSEIHGSYDNSHLLDPQLGTKIGDGPGSCFCHNVSE